MATTFQSSDPHFDVGAVNRHVADDLTSIFGAERRETPVPVEPPAAASTGRRRPLLALVGAGALVAMVAGGLTIGHVATGDADASRPLERSRPAAPAPAPAQPVVALSAAALPAPVSTEPEPAVVPPPVDLATTSTVRERPARVRREVASIDSEADGLPAAYPAVEVPAPPVMAPARQPSCEDRGDCANGALVAADRQVAAAYNDAIGAGVRNRDLRDYRAEWVRARSRAASDPQGALRIYGMVAADLDTLAQDAATRPTMAWR